MEKMFKFEAISQSQLLDVAKKIALILEDNKQPFTCYLHGDLGAGKTTLVREILRALGLSLDVEVTSPTYTLMVEYEIGGQYFVHLDLYRGIKGEELENLGLTEVGRFQGIFIEWPSIDCELVKVLPPTLDIYISLSPGAPGLREVRVEGLPY